MQLSILLPIFLTVFLAELGDKTQLATLGLAAAGQQSPWLVFAATTLALTTSSALAVLLGSVAGQHLTMLPLKLISGAAFIGLGVWMVWEYCRVG